MTSQRKFKSTAAIFAVATIVAAAQAKAVGGSFTIAPSENRTIYDFGNMTGWITIQTDQPLNLRWVHTGEKKDIVYAPGSLTLQLPAKIDGHLEASNTGGSEAHVHVTEHTKVANLAQTWEAFWGTAAGGHHSVINDAHREVKRWVKKCLGLCKG